MSADDIVTWLRETGTPEGIQSLSRFGIPNDNAFGVPVGDMRKKAKAVGIDHAAAQVLWSLGAYEARMMAVFIADPEKISPNEADQWCSEFDNWAICDTACFSLLDQTPFRWKKVHQWAPDEREFVRRAGFAMIWSLSTHDKTACDDLFIETFGLMEMAATDERPLVKKAVDMALRATGKRNAGLNQKARALAEKLSNDPDKTARWIGRHALKELDSQSVLSRIEKRQNR